MQRFGEMALDSRWLQQVRGKMESNMKNKRILFISFLFLLLVNSAYFWLRLPSFWDMGITIILFLGYLALVLTLLTQIWLLYREKFKNKSRIVNIIVLSSVLLLTTIFPYGMYDFEKLEGHDVIIAQRESVANCTTTLKMKSSNRFVEKSVCFGVDRHEGEYAIIGDTIKFLFEKESNFSSKSAFGIIRLNKNPASKPIGEIIYYRNLHDLNPLSLRIMKYDLK